jgi:myosin heavy subunit
MATEEKSIEISYKANIQDLKSKLSQIPNITDQEAKKMVAALDRQLKQAESAGKKAAEASKKAAQSASRAAMNAQKDFDELAHSAKRAEEKLDLVAEKSGDIDRGFSSVGLALRGVNPQLAEAADGLADVFAVGEGVLLTFKSLNPYVLAATVALGALTLAYTAYNMKAEEARKKAEEMEQAIKDLSTAIQDQQDIISQTDSQLGSYINQLNESNNQLALMTGTMSDYDLATAQATATAEKHRSSIRGTYDEQISALKTSISSREQQISLMETQLDTEKKIFDQNNKSSMSISASAAAEKAIQAEKYATLKKQLEPIKQAQVLDKEKLSTLYEQSNSLMKQADQLEENLTKIANIKEQEKRREQAAKRRQEAERKRQEELAKELEIQRQLEEAQQKEIARLKAIEDSIQAANEQLSQRQSHLDELQKIIDENTMSEQALKERAFEAELTRISEIGRMTGDYHLADVAIFTEVQKRKMELLAEEQKKREDMAKLQKEQTADLLSGVEAFSSATLQAAIDNGVANSKVIGGLFAMQQASAIAQIAFSTSEAIAKAMTYPPPLNGIMAGLAVATGAAQTASVMAQKPPTPSMHMGGVAPDEMSATVLKGEAILDRGTVRKLGGEQGIKNLQQSSPKQDNIVVVQPFRHFGRFVREIGFKAPKQTGIRVY